MRLSDKPEAMRLSNIRMAEALLYLIMARETLTVDLPENYYAKLKYP